MTVLENSIRIDAPPEKVWSVLASLDALDQYGLVLGQLVAPTADERHRLVARWEQGPSVEALAPGQRREEAGALVVAAVGQSGRAAGVARARREHVVAVLHHEHRDALATEAAHDAEPSVVGAQHQGARSVRTIRPRSRRVLVREAPRHRRIARARRGPANAVPATKRMYGPKLHAAGAPTK